jgi:hypothetical protein
MGLSKLTCTLKWLVRSPQARRSPSASLFLLALFGALLLPGCVSLPDPETSQIHEQEVIATLIPDDSSLGQTFISRRAGLNSLTIWLASEQAEAQGSLQVELLHSVSDPKPVFLAVLSTRGISTKRLFQFSFPIQNDPPGQAYYLHLSASGKSLQVYGRSEDIYPSGDFYVNEVPVQADLAFRTTYAYGWNSLFEDLRVWIKSAWLVIPLGLLLLVPGWLLFDLAGYFNESDLGEKIALSTGASLAIIPLVMLWTTALKLPWSSAVIWIILGLLLAILVMRLLQRIRNRSLPSPISPGDSPLSPIPYPFEESRNTSSFYITLTLIGIFLLSLSIRLIMVRDYATPAWVDSVHHGLITRLILEQGSFPASYAPYLNIHITEYHPGFHSVLASLIWLSGLSIDQAMLILGQVLNALAVFSSYLFTVSMLSDRRAGLIAAALTGLFTPMPAYYASWGRYTHLAGMLVLPVFFAILKILWDQSSHRPILTFNASSKVPNLSFPLKPVIILSLVAGGLFLTHYRIAGFAFLLAFAYLVFQSPSNLQLFVKKTILASLAALLALLLILPWFWPTLTQTLLPKLSAPVSPQPLFNGFTWLYLASGLGIYTLVLAIFGLILGLSFRKQFAFTLLLWVILLFALPNLSALGLPGGSFVNQTAVEISLYLPISVLGSYFLSRAVGITDHFPKKGWRQVSRAGLLLLAVILIFLGAKRTLTILNPVTVLSRQPDLPALSWIENNLPHSETIAINPFLWGYGFYAGSDGGYWISPLTGNPTFPPPVLYGVSSIKEIDHINQVSAQIIAQGDNASALAIILRQNHIRYVYLGARGGAISVSSLKESTDFIPLFQSNGSSLFELISPGDAESPDE